MTPILKLYLDICRLRKGPEDVPYSNVLALVTLIFYGFFLLLARVGVGGLSFQFSALSLAMILGVFSLTLFLFLAFKKLSSRFLQTFTALIGSDLVITAFSLPLVWANSLGERNALSMTTGLMILALMVWDLIVKGFIFQRAMGISSLQGNLLALAMIMLTLNLDESLYRALGGQ